VRRKLNRIRARNGCICCFACDVGGVIDTGGPVWHPWRCIGVTFSSPYAFLSRLSLHFIATAFRASRFHSVFALAGHDSFTI
jgi:hypothetical protein